MHPFLYQLERKPTAAACLAAMLSILLIAGPCWAQEVPSTVLTQRDDGSSANDTPPSTPQGATPSSVETCSQQHETAQVERMAGHLQEARDALLACSREECPSVVRVDCVKWLDEVRADIPTVIFEALGDEGLVTDVEVKLGERIVATRLDGKPIEVPVGLSEFTFTKASGERKTFRIVLRAGETNRIIWADFRTHDPALVAAAPAVPPPVELVDTRPVPTSVWLLGTAAVAATLTGATLGIVAKVKEGDAAEACAPDCTEGVVSEIENVALAADISFGVAIVAGLATTILYLSRPTIRVPSEMALARPRLLVSDHGAWLGIEGRFQ
jgi:hypothetical protein